MITRSATRQRHLAGTYLDGVEAGDDAAVLHLHVRRGVGELALILRAGAFVALILATHLQRQPARVLGVGIQHGCDGVDHGHHRLGRRRGDSVLEDRRLDHATRCTLLLVALTTTRARHRGEGEEKIMWG